MVKLSTLDAMLKVGGSIRNIDKSQKLISTLTDKLKLDTSNRLLMYNPDLLILIGRYVESKFIGEDIDFKVDLVFKVINSIFTPETSIPQTNQYGQPQTNGTIQENEKQIIMYITKNLFAGNYIKPLSNSEWCLQYVVDIFKKLV